VARFGDRELGLSLVLSRERDEGAAAAADDTAASLRRTVVVVARTFPDRGGGVAHAKLAPDDELLAVLYDPDASPLADAERLPEDLRVDDFNALLANLRACARPVSLVFRRPRAPARRDSSLARRDSGAAAAPADGPGGEGSDDEEDLEAMEFFCLDNDATSAHLDALAFPDLRAKWRSRAVDGDTKVYFRDTWQSIRHIPRLIAKLDAPPTTFFDNLDLSAKN